jgi:hypothetical protein
VNRIHDPGVALAPGQERRDHEVEMGERVLNALQSARLVLHLFQDCCM